MLTNPAHFTILKTAINSETDPAFVAARTVGEIGVMADFYNTLSQKVIWKTSVTRAEIYHTTSTEGTTWNWTTYKQQSVTEQNAWTQMFMGDVANMSLPNLRAGITAIFTGSAAQNQQAAHILSVGKRFARKGEAIYVAGQADSLNPGIAVVEGFITNSDIITALGS